MIANEVRGIVRGRTVVLADDAPDLPDGTEVVIAPYRRPLTGVEIASRLRDLPPLSKEDADALEQSIEEGNREIRRRLAVNDAKRESNAE